MACFILMDRLSGQVSKMALCGKNVKLTGGGTGRDALSTVKTKQKSGVRQHFYDLLINNINI